MNMLSIHSNLCMFLLNRLYKLWLLIMSNILLNKMMYNYLMSIHLYFHNILHFNLFYYLFLLLFIPAAQDEHADKPLELVYVPAEQIVQTVAPDNE